MPIVTAKAGGAQKIYWILNETALNRRRRRPFPLHFPRRPCERGTVAYLQFKAVYADGVKTKDIAITIKEAIPEPVFTLQGADEWDGRSTIEVVPQIKNLAAMQAAKVGDLKFEWSVRAFADQGSGTRKTRLLRSQNSGKLTVTAT